MTQHTDDPNFDKYAVDVKAVTEAENRKDGSKVKWHNIPEGDSTSTWRILPYIKHRSFFFKMTKHWNVPGFKGSITCPRSFNDPDNPGKKLRCAICERFFELYKSKDPADQAIAKSLLRSSQSYYANAINVDKPEDGVGVLNLPYAVWSHLFGWLTMPKFQMFSHPKLGRAIIIQSKSVQGTLIPGTDKQKRDYSVTPDDPSPIPDMSVLEGLYDLEEVVGIPTFETTKVCLDRLLGGSEDVAKLPDNVYRNRKALGTGDQTPNTAPATYVATTPPVAAPAFVSTPAPAFVQPPVQKAPEQPTTGSTSASQNDIEMMLKAALDGTLK